jgi:antitoxin HicB
MAKSKKPSRYTVIIQWSEEDDCFIASLPEWAPYASTDAMGATYEEAAKNAHEILEMLMQDENGKPAKLPPEKLFHYPGADVINRPHTRVGQPRREPVRSKSRQSA